MAVDYALEELMSTLGEYSDYLKYCCKGCDLQF